MIRALFALLFSRLLLLLARRHQQSAPKKANRRPAHLVGSSWRLSFDVCRCRLREVLRERNAAWKIVQLGIEERRLHAIRAGHAEPTLEEKLLIVRGINCAHPSSRKPPVAYDELFGSRATPRVCTCELRRLLDTHDLRADEAARALGITRKTVITWRAGTAQPSPEQLDTLRALAARAGDVVAFRDRGTIRRRA
ncbi:MAG: hypothetical protein ACXWLY_31335 [Thermoanaerobaculia bacterium]